MNLFSQILLSDEDISSIEIPSVSNSIKNLYSDFDHKVWDKESLRDFIKEEFDKEVLETYYMLQPYAYKADLGRYCILSKLGGWYSDINNEMIINVIPDDTTDMIIFRDMPKNSNSSWAVQVSLIYSKPNNPVFDIAINKVVQNAKMRYYGITPLCPTGPTVFGQAIAIVGDISRYRIGDFLSNGFNIFSLSDGSVIAKYKSFSGGDVGIKGTNNYNDFWRDKNVYGELN